MNGPPSPKHRGSGRASERDAEPLMDINEVAAFLNTTVRHIRRLVLERRIPHYKVGGKLRFGRQETHDWVAASRVPVQGPDLWPVRTGRRRAS